jgi:hypothetical protein
VSAALLAQFQNYFTRFREGQERRNARDVPGERPEINVLRTKQCARKILALPLHLDDVSIPEIFSRIKINAFVISVSVGEIIHQ